MGHHKIISYTKKNTLQSIHKSLPTDRPTNLVTSSSTRRKNEVWWSCHFRRNSSSTSPPILSHALVTSSCRTHPPGFSGHAYQTSLFFSWRWIFFLFKQLIPWNVTVCGPHLIIDFCPLHNLITPLTLFSFIPLHNLITPLTLFSFIPLHNLITPLALFNSSPCTI